MKLNIRRMLMAGADAPPADQVGDGRILKRSMKRPGLLASLVLLTAVVAFGGVAASDQRAPSGPGVATRLAGGLLLPGGMTIGPDGMLYVAESGAALATAPNSGLTPGLTGRISKIDPVSGARTTVIDGLPNYSFGEAGGVSGPADVAFLGTQLYYLGPSSELTPSIYRVSNGAPALVADIGTFDAANPFGTGGFGSRITAQEEAFYLVDSLEQLALKVTAAGAVSRLDGVATVEPTRVTLSGRGPFYVNSVGPFRHAPELAGVYSVPYPTGNLVVAAGDSDVTDVEVGPSGQVHALSIRGQVLKADAKTGPMSVIVDGFPAAGGLTFAGDSAYFFPGDTVDPTGAPIAHDGEVWKITGFSSVTSPAPQSVGVAAPNAGAGPAAAGSSGVPLTLLLVLGITGAVVLVVATSARLLWKRTARGGT